MQLRKSLLAGVVLAAITSSAWAQPEAVYSSVLLDPNNLVPHPTAIVPDNAVPGPNNPNEPNGVAEGDIFSSFDRPERSPDGSRWMMLARTLGSTSFDAVYITGVGVEGALRIRERTTQIVAGRTPDSMADRDVAIADNGDYLVTLGLDGDSANDEVLVFGFGEPGDANDPSIPFVIEYAEGQVVDEPNNGLDPNLPAGVIYGSFNYSANLANGGTQLAFGWDNTGGGIGSADDVMFFLMPETPPVARDGATIPGNQLGGGGDVMENFTNTSFHVAENGTDWLIQGNLNTPGSVDDNVVLVARNNNDPNVVLQEGAMLGSLSGTISSITLPKMEANGDWFARGKNDDANTTGWCVKNGAVVAASGDAVPGGEMGETWDPTVWTSSSGVTFFIVTGNNNGDYVYGGFTSNADPDRNAAWIYVDAADPNNPTIILRNGDQIDLDRDGNVDDVFVYFSSLTTASPKPLGGFLTDDGWFYTTIDIRNGAGDDLGEALIRIEVAPAPACPEDVDGSGTIDSTDLSILLSNFGTTSGASPSDGDIDGDGDVDSTDLSLLLTVFGAPCP